MTDKELKEECKRQKAEEKAERQRMQEEEREKVIRGTEKRYAIDADHFVRGGMDCRHGEPHRPGQHPDYDRGYSAQYEMEQIKTELSINGR